MTGRSNAHRDCRPASLLLALLAGCGAEQRGTAGMDGAAAPRGQAERVAAVAAEEVRRRSPTRPPQAVEPFSNQKLTVALKQEARQPNSMLGAELNRRKEPLEAYPLDSMSMVGSVAKQAQPFALLRVDNLLYQVKLGDYLGQNYGRITKITETQIVAARDRAGRRWRMDRAPQHPAASGEGTMKSTQENRMMQQVARHSRRRWRLHSQRRSRRSRRTRSSRSPASQQAGTDVVRIELSEPLAAVPGGFSVQAPPRVAIDLPGVGNAPGQELGGAEPGQPALGQRGAVRRAHAPGAEPAPGRQLPRRSCRARR